MPLQRNRKNQPSSSSHHLKRVLAPDTSESKGLPPVKVIGAVLFAQTYTVIWLEVALLLLCLVRRIIFIR